MANVDTGNIVVSPYIREAFNKIKISIDFSAVGKDSKALIFTSAASSEGKSSMAVNTALSMAFGGGRTVLIDCDMRKPTVHRLFNIIFGYGLSDIIAKNVNWEQCVNDVGVPNLHVITSGRKPPNPVELLGSQKMLTLINELRSQYDYIVLDASPIMPVPDVLALSKYADGVILVIRHGYTRIKALQESIRSLALANATIIGTILNDVPSSDKKFGYGYEAGYGYPADKRSAANHGKSRRKRKNEMPEMPGRK